MNFKHPIPIVLRVTCRLTPAQASVGWTCNIPPTIPTFRASLPLTVAEQKPHRATCASYPQNGAQLLIPPAPALPPTPSRDYLRFFPISNPHLPPTQATNAEISHRGNGTPDPRPFGQPAPGFLTFSSQSSIFLKDDGLGPTDSAT